MEDENGTKPLSFESRLSRSKGRLGRFQVAQARVTDSEYVEVLAAAKREGKAVAEWVRDVLLREARRKKRDPLFTEIVATRMLLNLALKPLVCREAMSAAEFSAMLTEVRTTKHEAALDVMQQYATDKQKER